MLRGCAGERFRWDRRKKKRGEKGKCAILDFHSGQPRRLNNTTEGDENPTQSWEHNAGRGVTWPHRNALSSLSILFLLFFFSGDFDRFRAWLPHFARVYWMGKAGWGGRFQCGPLLFHVWCPFITSSTVQILRGGQPMGTHPFFSSSFFLLYYCSYYFYFSHADQNRQWTDGLLDIVYGHNTVVRLAFVFSTPV